MSELRILFIQESCDYCASIEEILASAGTDIRSEHISDSSYMDALSRNSWDVVIGEDALLRAGSPGLDIFRTFLPAASGIMPLIVVTNHHMGTAYFVTLDSISGIARKDNAEELAETIRTMLVNPEPRTGSDAAGRDASVQAGTLKEQIAQRTYQLGLANRRLLAEIHERRKAEIALTRSEEQLRRSRDELEQRVMRRTAELARSDKESHELYKLLDKMFSVTRMLIAYLDTDLRYVRVNKAFAGINGLDPECFVGRHYLDLCPVTEHESVFRNVIATGKTYSAYKQRFAFPAIKSSRPMYWDWYVQPSIDASGQVDGLIIGLINVTNRILSETALGQSEQRLSDAQRMAHMGSWVLNPDRGIMECSDEFYRIFGLEKHKRIKLATVLHHVHPDHREMMMEKLNRATSDGEPRIFEHLIVRNDGTERIAEVRLEVHNHGTGPKLITGITHDITSLRSAEQSRRESEEHLRSFIDSATDSFMLFDKQFNLVEINANAAELWGGARSTLLGRHLFEIMPDSRKSGQYTLYRRVLETGNPVFFDHIVENRKTSNKYYYQQAFRAGEDLGIIFTEITDRKRYENTLIQKQRQLELMLKHETLLARIASRLNSPEPFDDVVRELLHMLAVELHVGAAAAWTVGGDHLIVDTIGEECTRVFTPGYIEKLHTLLPFRGIDHRLIIPDVHDLPQEEQGYFTSSHVTSVALLPAAIAEKTVGYLCFCDVKRHVWQSEELYLLGTAADIFASAWERQHQIKARAEAEHQRIEALQMAEKASRLASIGEIAGGITHEINQPLTAIKVSADSIRFWNRNNKSILPEKFITMIDKISLSVDRISEIIRHMRSFWVSPNLVEHTAVDLNSVVDRALSLLNRQIHAHRIKSVVDKCDQDIVIIGNPIHLEQIIINLVVNSLNALDRVDRSDKMITIVTRKDTGMAILSVIDNGTGLPPGAENKIFDPFFSTSKPGEGTGLGLAITKRFVDAHNGDIHADVNMPYGTIFTVRIPLRTSKEEPHEHTAC